MNLEAEDRWLVLLRRSRKTARVLKQKHVWERGSKERSIDVYSSVDCPIRTRKQWWRIVHLLAAGTKEFHAVHARLVAQSHRKEILIVTENARATAKMTSLVLLEL